VNSPYPGRFRRDAWAPTMWANVNREATGKPIPLTSGGYWSGVEYVLRWRLDGRSVSGRRARIMVPRGQMAAIYAPHLAVRPCRADEGGAQRAGDLPKAGRLVMFPSWLLHQVRPYRMAHAPSASQSPQSSRCEGWSVRPAAKRRISSPIKFDSSLPHY